jgi:cytidyltransferase-like protein
MSKIILTLGVFDSFHIGHLEALKKSCKFGDTLIVGVQSDEAVKKQKGRNTIASENERSDIVNALKIVSSTFIYKNAADIAKKNIYFDVFAHCEDINQQTLFEIKKHFSNKTYISFPRTSGVSSTMRRPPIVENDKRIAVDYHDTFTAYPELLSIILRSFKPENIFILTGTPSSRLNPIRDELTSRGFSSVKVIGGFEYDNEHMGKDHFKRMADHKLHMLKLHKIHIYIEDNPMYVACMKENLPNVLILQHILSNEYILKFSGKHADLTGNLQTTQFDFLKILDSTGNQ